MKYLASHGFEQPFPLAVHGTPHYFLYLNMRNEKNLSLNKRIKTPSIVEILSRFGPLGELNQYSWKSSTVFRRSTHSFCFLWYHKFLLLLPCAFFRCSCALLMAPAMLGSLNKKKLSKRNLNSTTSAERVKSVCALKSNSTILLKHVAHKQSISKSKIHLNILKWYLTEGKNPNSANKIVA